jgi:putative nucleotidyltransferase with HDIG domain
MDNLIDLACENLDTYYNSFTGLSVQQKKNFKIKYEHSLRVAEICSQLADKLNVDGKEKELAVITGVFHDIGRFKQLIEFNTFNDSVAGDHAKYSVEILKAQGFLDDIEAAEVVLEAIAHHNKRKIPDYLSDKKLFFAKLIRDADKLDILKVITDYYTNTNESPNHTLTWDMPESDTISEKVAAQVLNDELISRENIQNQLDIKVMQLSWIFDFNFKPSLEILKEKNYMEIIFNSMPKNDTVLKIYHKVKDYLECATIKELG